MIHHISVTPDRAILPKGVKPTLMVQGCSIYFTRNYYVNVGKENKCVIYFYDEEEDVFEFSDVCDKKIDYQEEDFFCEIALNSKLDILNSYFDPELKHPFEVNIIPLRKIFIINGTSSSGKSSISDKLGIKGYEVLHQDTMLVSLNRPLDKYDIYSDDSYFYRKVDNMLEEDHRILDLVNRDVIDGVYNILIFVGLDRLCQNIKARANKDLRLVVPFISYTEFYKCVEVRKPSLENVSRDMFEKSLLKHCKFLFQNHLDLKEFTYNIFKKMGASEDGKMYSVVPRTNRWNSVIVNDKIPSSIKLVQGYINRHK